MKKQLALKLLLLFIITNLLIPQNNHLNISTITSSGIKAIHKQNEELSTKAINEISLYEYSCLDDDGGNVKGIIVQGNLAYIANYDQGLEILNVSNPAEPYKISSIKTKGKALDVHILKNFTYISQKNKGVAVINIENPLQPVYVTDIEEGKTVYEVTSYRNILYFITNNGLYTYEISNPNQPLFLSHWESTSGFYQYTGVSVVYKYVCLSNNITGLEIIDMTFTSNPFLISEWNNSTGAGSGVFTKFVDDRTIAFLADEYAGLQIIDYTNLTSPIRIGNYDSIGKIMDVYVKNDIAYCCKDNQGIVLVDVSDLNNPVELGSFDTDGNCKDVWSDSNHAFCADEKNGLQILEVSNPNNIYKIAEFFDLGSASKIASAGNLAYLADTNAGLEIINISDTLNPTKIGQYNDGAIVAYHVTISDNQAIISGLETGIHVLDISDKTNPVKINTFSDGKDFRKTVVKDDLIFTCSMQSSSILILNKSNLPTISIEGEYTFSTPETSAISLEIVNDVLIVGSDKEGLKLLNITDVSNITVLDEFNDNGNIADFEYHDEKLYTTFGNNNLSIIDISDNNISQISEISTGGIGVDITISNDIVYIALRENGIGIINVSDINNPMNVGNYEDVNCFGINTYQQFILTAAQDEGLRVFALDSDSDLITDADELYIWGTDPYDSDTDDDLIPDGFEAYNQLNPLNSSDSSDDPDADDLSNYEEYIQLFTYGDSTDPNNNDTDGDLMPDGWEVMYDINPLVVNAIGSPFNDADNDYLDNYHEYLYGTHPREKDTDGDGAWDGIEILYNTDPLNPKDNPERDRKIRLIVVLVLVAISFVCGLFLYVRYMRKRIERNLKREQRIQESEEDVLIF